jgi:hypothetical protein
VTGTVQDEEDRMRIADILLIDESPFARQFRHVVGLVDHLHRFAASPRIPLVLTKCHHESGAYRYRLRPSQPLSIAVSRYATFPSLTLLHEIGHFLDHLSLNRAKCGFASEFDPVFEPLRSCWTQSALVQRMNAVARSSRTSPHVRATVRYQLAIRELWARTYLQWAIARSEDIMLLACFQADAGSLRMNCPPTDYYWDDVELHDIIPLVDQLFFEAGLA